ncbi:MAG: dTDP-4-dehydrorhamnose reductase [Acidobacteria bacterium]|jgi:dTDP-4-dehydrorhamnose reductase|nr:dTDP-4-dehydrorhamnose reductase [Acidobacteriota bacterium]
MKIAVIGADGQLGTDICKAIAKTNHELLRLTIADIDVADHASVSRVLEELTPGLVINTAAFHHVEKCEEETIKAFEVNALGPRNLARVCNHIDAALMHISTDYVFDGKKRAPYIETDNPMPLNVYANTKLAGEYFIEATARKYYILRVCGIYGKSPCLGKGGMNFVELMLKLSRERDEVRVVDDEILTPTSTVEIAAQIVKMIGANAQYGLYHATAEGSCSWFEFAAEIFNITKPNIKFNKAAPGEFAVKVNRPSYSVLENKFLKDQGIHIMRHWKEGLRDYLKLK